MVPARSPRYLEIAAELRRRLDSAGAGDPLPSEAELSEMHGVSRMTARQAVKSLEAEGLVYRVPGSGTYASGAGADQTVGVWRSFTEEMDERGVEVTSKVLFSGWVEPTPDIAAELGIAPGSRAVRVARIRLGDGLPVALDTVTLPPRCAFVLGCDLATNSVRRILEDRDIVFTEARGTIVATTADANDAEKLGIPMESPLLVERLRVEDQYGERVMTRETRYVGSKYVCDVHLCREGGRS
ncbi:hypothetical protein BFN03_10875 [Rhodococcus sp. WMMA185]|uniref:GntR family transcriptional regulator n=1 Tax=Rhodococcus sp. WMMA185 TaxID=679318 RepID=UPI0008790B51|nr:GntR family transcriptional regulator [Rhodococcus sp. WMMA185]AOW92993.1 hypothetical protein BFN03_10875 [Rhodococcus sp. WMMA185]